MVRIAIGFAVLGFVSGAAFNELRWETPMSVADGERHANRLYIGMSRDEVRWILGEPTYEVDGEEYFDIGRSAQTIMVDYSGESSADGPTDKVTRVSFGPAGPAE